MNRRFYWVSLTALLLIPPLIVAGLIFMRTAKSHAASTSASHLDITVEFDRNVPPVTWLMRPLAVVPPLPSPEEPLRMDFRHADASTLDLSGLGAILSQSATFDTSTVWPANLPLPFQPARLLEEGKDPGLGIRALHQKGITGAGVRVAYIAGQLWRGHPEYQHAVARYTEVGRLFPKQWWAQISVLAGLSSGVAPDVRVDYYAVQLEKDASSHTSTFVYVAAAIDMILDENRTAPPDKRIRVICAPMGANPKDDGYAALMQAYQRARREGVLITSSNMDSLYSYQIVGLGRKPYGDPNSASTYTIGSFWADLWFQNRGNLPTGGSKVLYVPMDARTVAMQSGPDFAYYPQGGIGVALPWGAGLYALAAQVQPSVTPEEFLRAAHETGDYVTASRAGQEYRLGPIVNPTRLLDRVQKGSGTP